MSVTFSAPNAPTELVGCWMCADTQRWEEDPDARCCGTCDGMLEQSTLPEINFANSNARDVLALMGCDGEDLCGSLEVTEIPAVLQRLLLAANSGIARTHLVRPSAVEVGRKGCTVIHGGNTDESSLRRITAVQRLLSGAAKGGFGVSWG